MQATLFDGATFDQQLDGNRLGAQLMRVQGLMRDGQWRTLQEIAARVGGSESGVSARLRDLRKSKYGRMVVERRRRDEPARGLFEYRVTQ